MFILFLKLNIANFLNTIKINILAIVFHLLLEKHFILLLVLFIFFELYLVTEPLECPLLLLWQHTSHLHNVCCNA